MAYERYKQIRTKEEFYKDFKKDKLVELTEELREYVYGKYVVKSKILQRDSFTCQNKDCEICNNEQYYHKLTWHHIKAQRNKKDKKVHKERNGVTLCKGIHQRYEKAKGKKFVIFPFSNMAPFNLFEEGEVFLNENIGKWVSDSIKTAIKKVAGK